MKKKYLLLFTDFYPFDKWETYLQPEMKFLPKYFDRIFIFSNNNGNGKPIYKIPENTEAFFLSPDISSFERISSFRFLFSKIFWEEIRWIKKNYQVTLSPVVIKIALISLLQAVRYKTRIEKFIKQKNLNDGDIFLYSYWADYRALAAALMHRQHSFTAISRAHGWDVYFERHPVPYLPFRKFIGRYLTGIFFISQDGSNYFKKITNNSSVAYLYISRLAIEGYEMNPAVGEGIFTLVSCSRLVPLKRVHLVAEILKNVNDLPVRWIHFGSGEIEEDFLRLVKSQLVNKKNIEFDFRGDVRQEELLKFYRKQHVDLFVLTSEYEGMPFVIIEALSFGIPVMATKVGGIAEVISNENGFLLEKDFQPADAAAMLVKFAAFSSEKKSIYRQKAFETWDRMFNAEKNFPEFISRILKTDHHEKPVES